ncbi:putative transport protein YifK [Arsenophonus endosymbiont of Bemisia tabaci Q2]|nr:putative transport protein YifK [Arsenophonus endosymbiont of Bemisia tabaci Q2]
MIYALAQNGQLPKSLLKVTANGVLARCIMLTILCLIVGSGLNYIIPDP